jgi:hypothetical protein
MLVLSMSGVLYSRAGRAILLLPIVTGLVFVVFSVFQKLGVEIFYERLASTENTRSQTWEHLLQGGMSSPLIGLGVEGAGDSENGYLYGFAAYGIGMVFLIVMLMATTGLMVLGLLRRRWSMDARYRAIVDLSIGYMAAYFAGSIFEGYMMARVASNLVFFMLFTGIAARVIRLHDDGLTAEEDDYLPEEGYEDEWSDEHAWAEADYA